jgi:hypothetical protein
MSMTCDVTGASQASLHVTVTPKWNEALVHLLERHSDPQPVDGVSRAEHLGQSIFHCCNAVPEVGRSLHESTLLTPSNHPSSNALFLETTSCKLCVLTRWRARDSLPVPLLVQLLRLWTQCTRLIESTCLASLHLAIK